MDLTVRQRALVIEMDARQFPPADGINRLAVRCAQLERALAEARAQLAAQHQRLTGWAPVIEYDGSFEPINTLMVDHDGPVG